MPPLITEIMPNVVTKEEILRHPEVMLRRNTTFGKNPITQIKNIVENICVIFSKICVIIGWNDFRDSLWEKERR